MSSLKDLLSQIETLQNQVAEVRQKEVGDAIAKVRAMIDEYQLTASDVFPGGKTKSSTKKTGKVAAKYRDPLTGNTWSGRGLAPKWMAGKNKADYLIAWFPWRRSPVKPHQTHVRVGFFMGRAQAPCLSEAP